MNDEYKIVHIFVNGPFLDDCGYQQNLLAKYNRKKYSNTTIIASNLQLNTSGEIELIEPKIYFDKSDVKIIRFRTNRTVERSYFYSFRLFCLLCKLKPDFIMLHVFSPFTSISVSLYKLFNPKSKLVADTHVLRAYHDFSNADTREKLFLLGQKIIGSVFYKLCHKIYGVTSQSIELVHEYMNVPKDKCEVLPLGYDDGDIQHDKKEQLKREIRIKYNIPEDMYIAVHGGKLSRNKKTLELVRIIKKYKKVFLIVFGEFESEKYAEEVIQENRVNVMYIGFLNQKQIYDLYLASDFAIFPGSPSVLRQQAVACGLPIIICCNDGDEDINILMGNNGLQLSRNWKPEELDDAIKNLLVNFDEYRCNATFLANGDFKQYTYEREADYIINN